MTRTILFIFTALAVFSCKNKNQAEPSADRLNMLQADRDFSQLSADKGMKNAFLEYMDSNAVLLRPNEMPILGADAVDYLIQMNDSTYSLTWRPKTGVVAKSGDLGYTYGIYTLKPTEKDTLIYGTYVSIWKKQADGRWKFVLDTDNEGVGDDENGEPAF
jgi:ketosteroid isomerase-like protein